MELNKEKIQFDYTEIKKFSSNVSLKELVDDGVKLLNVTANAVCGRSEVLNDEVVVEGVISFCAIINTEDGIKKINRSERFCINENVQGASPKAYMLASACTDKVRGFVEAGSLMLAACIDISAILVTPIERDCYNSISGEEYRVKTQNVNLNKIDFAQNIRFSVSDETELSPRVPEIKEILNTNASVCVNEAHISAGQLIIGGRILMQTVYHSVDEYEPVVQVNDGFDFSQIIDIRNNEQSEPIVCLCIEEIGTSVALNEQGEMRKIMYSVGLVGYAYSCKSEDVELICDIYSIKNRLLCECDKIEITDSCGCFDINTNKNISVILPEGKTPIARINAVSFTPCAVSCVNNKSSVTIKCSGEVSAVYTASGTGENDGFNTTVEFDVFVENDQLSDAMQIGAKITLTDMQAVMVSGNEIEIRGGFNVQLCSQKNVRCVMVNSIKDDENDNFPEFGIIIYNVKKGDELWDIAKKFGVDKDDILKLNPDINEKLDENKKIYIFRKLIV